MPELVPIPAFNDNYIWLLHDRKSALVVDPGDADPVVEFLDRMRIRLGAILITHHHGDHTGGINKLIARFHCPVYGPSAEDIPHCSHPLRDGDEIHFPELGVRFRVIATPGHTLGHVSYYGSGYLFCGDTLFGCGCGRLFEGTPQQMHRSLIRLSSLPDDTLVCCAHEYTISNIRFALTIDADNPLLLNREYLDGQTRNAGKPTLPSTLITEKHTNPFLRCDKPAIRKAAEQISGHPLADETEIFAVIRSAKDNFRA